MNDMQYYGDKTGSDNPFDIAKSPSKEEDRSRFRGRKSPHAPTGKSDDRSGESPSHFGNSFDPPAQNFIGSQSSATPKSRRSRGSIRKQKDHLGYDEEEKKSDDRRIDRNSFGYNQQSMAARGRMIQQQICSNYTTQAQ